MELRDIRYFAVIAEHQNIGRAADALGLSATALSKSLHRLETHLGAKLVQRAPKGVALTSVGAALLARSGPLQGMLRDVQQEATDLAQGRAGHVHVSTSSGAPEHLLGNACAAFSKMSPEVTLEISVEYPDYLHAVMRKGEMDFCVANAQLFSPAEFTCEHLYDSPFVIFSSANHRLAAFKKLQLADLAGERWALMTNAKWQEWLPQVFKASCLAPPKYTLETNSETVRFLAIAYSSYLGISSRQYLRQEAKRYPLVELPIKEMSEIRRVSIIYRKGAYLSPAAKRLIEILKSHANEMSGGIRRTSLSKAL